jgi:hypothetical protein
MGLATLLFGCGRKGLDRLPVHGTVTFANGEKPDCSIMFKPAKGQPGPSATTKVVNGNYQFDRTNGPTAGPHTVTVARIIHRSLQKLSDKKASAEKKPATNKKTAADNQAGPDEKTEWTESADIADDGRYLQDFTLKD